MILEVGYKTELDSLLLERNLSVKDIPGILEQLVDVASRHQGKHHTVSADVTRHTHYNSLIINYIADNYYPASKSHITSNMESLVGAYFEMKNLEKRKEKSAGNKLSCRRQEKCSREYFCCTLVGSKARQKFSAAMSKTKNKAERLVQIINEQHESSVAEQASAGSGVDDDELGGAPYVTMEDFQRGEFPWQTGNTGTSYTRVLVEKQF